MNQSLNYSAGVEACSPLPQIADNLVLAATKTPVASLIHLLAGSADATLADPGLTHLPRDQQDAVSGNASRESEACLDCALVLLRLMEHTLENDCPLPSSDLLTIAQHITRLLQDHDRWHTLADNAAYYRDHPQVSARIATLQKR